MYRGEREEEEGRREVRIEAMEIICEVFAVACSNDNRSSGWVAIKMKGHRFNLGYVVEMESTFLDFLA